ncbi:hypothetical protein BC628DRAFT_1420121 [Trametes gibbosa]|nr:hypothetical protein BC628DRAFT_1420121 [Trametes gibbosa]
MPALETLSVTFDPHSDLIRYDGMSSESDESEPPDPREVEVLEWSPEAPNFPRLAELPLGGYCCGPRQYPRSVAQTAGAAQLCKKSSTSLQFLRQCINLEHLTLHRYRFREIQFLEEPRVSLPATLLKLILHNSESSFDDLVDFNDDIRGPIHFCLPEDKSGIPILSAATRVRVELQRHDGPCTLTGIAELRSISIVAPPQQSRAISPNIVQVAAIFGNAPLTDFVIIGVGKREVATTDWAHTLSCFPLFERLAVISVPHRPPHDPLFTLLEALQSAGKPLCPNMRELALSSHEERNDGEVLDAIAECLENRQVQGQHLAKLHLGLSVTHHGDAVVVAAVCGREVRCHRALGSLAHSVECGDDGSFLSDPNSCLHTKHDDCGSEEAADWHIKCQ